MFFESLDAHYLVAVGGKPVDNEDMAKHLWCPISADKHSQGGAKLWCQMAVWEQLLQISRCRMFEQRQRFTDTVKRHFSNVYIMTIFKIRLSGIVVCKRPSAV